MRAYLFVDAENHFLRATAAVEEITGLPNAARAMAAAKTRVPGIRGFPDHINGERFAWNPELQLFWDCEVLSRGGLLADLQASIARAIFACSCTGDDEKEHEMQVQLRGYGFEPLVVREPKNLRQHREATRRKHGLIEKPKGCDIAIATRMVADAAADLYECCLLFTSDADFLPAIEAVRRMGKIVWVFGFASALPSRSRYLYVPDRFVDLEPHIRSAWKNNRHQIQEALRALESRGNEQQGAAF